MEIGGDHHGFHREVIVDNTRDGLDLGHRGSMEQECAFYSHFGEHFFGQIDKYLHLRGCGTSWGSHISGLG